ncbi:MAG: toll/interleukin-1 receptor domain-containing protein [Nitrospira sp.]|nr:toll/interleukin-1 receptor domain-containing protein [Nitrospira sp.]
MSKILISYRREDSADVTGRIYDRLIQAFPKAVFRDVDSMPPGIDFRHHLDEQVAKCDVFLAVIGRNWMKLKGRTGKSRLEDQGDFVRIEIESALKRRIPVIPVLVSGAVIPPVDRLPVSLRDFSYRHSVVVRSDPDFHRDMDRLIEYLRAQIESERENLPPSDAQHTVTEAIATEAAARSEVKGPGQENVEVAVPPSSLESQPEVPPSHEEAPIAFSDAHSTVRDGSATGKEPDCGVDRGEQESVEAAVPPSRLDSQPQLEPGEEEPASSTVASRTTTEGFPSYLVGGIGLIVFIIVLIAAFLIFQPKPSPVYAPSPRLEKMKEQVEQLKEKIKQRKEAEPVERRP